MKAHDWKVSDFIDTWICRDCNGYYFGPDGAPGPHSFATIDTYDDADFFSRQYYADCDLAQVARIILE